MSHAHEIVFERLDTFLASCLPCDFSELEIINNNCQGLSGASGLGVSVYCVRDQECFDVSNRLILMNKYQEDQKQDK